MAQFQTVLIGACLYALSICNCFCQDNLQFWVFPYATFPKLPGFRALSLHASPLTDLVNLSRMRPRLAHGCLCVGPARLSAWTRPGGWGRIQLARGSWLPSSILSAAGGSVIAAQPKGTQPTIQVLSPERVFPIEILLGTWPLKASRCVFFCFVERPWQMSNKSV